MDTKIVPQCNFCIWLSLIYRIVYPLIFRLPILIQVQPVRSGMELVKALAILDKFNNFTGC